MASLDIDSLFTNIPLDETIDICVHSLYKDDENARKIPKDVFRNFLTVANKEPFFMFNNKFYKQTVGVPMGSPLGLALANIFICSLSFLDINIFREKRKFSRVYTNFNSFIHETYKTGLIKSLLRCFNLLSIL